MATTQEGLTRLGNWQWPLLLALAAMLSMTLSALGINAAMFMGPLLAGLAFAFGGSDRRLSRNWTVVSQALIGVVVARSLDVDVLAFVASHLAVVAFVVLATCVLSITIALGLVRFGGMDPETAAWGSMPGAAGIMVAFAAEYGGDTRMVAFMQYVRLIAIIAIASVVTSLLSPASHVGTGVVALRPVSPGIEQTLMTLGVAVVGTVLGRLLRFPAGPLLLTAVLGALLHNFGVVDVALPRWLLAVAYGLLGLFVGMQFDREVLGAAFRRLPAILIATVVLGAVCAMVGFLLSWMMGVDALTGYLATSPGAIDSIAVLALDAAGNLSVVMAVQAIRFFVVIMVAPLQVRIIRWLIRRPETVTEG